MQVTQGNFYKEYTVKIYRVEDCNGIGPYQNSNTFKFLSDFSLQKHPMVNNSKIEDFADEHGYNVEDVFFGFESINQLKNWFSKKVLDNLYKINYHVAVYEISIKYAVSDNKQVIFFMEEAEKLDEIERIS